MVDLVRFQAAVDISFSCERHIVRESIKVGHAEEGPF